MKGAPETQRSLSQRIGGLILIAVAMFTLDSGSNAPLHTLVLPLAMAVGAMFALQNVLAVLLAIIALAGIRAEWGHPDWVIGIAYPALAIVAVIAAAVLLWRRFQQQIEDTREARKARRER